MRAAPLTLLLLAACSGGGDPEALGNADDNRFVIGVEVVQHDNVAEASPAANADAAETDANAL